jgi:hypothetical protein
MSKVRIFCATCTSIFLIIYGLDEGHRKKIAGNVFIDSSFK